MYILSLLPNPLPGILYNTRPNPISKNPTRWPLPPAAHLSLQTSAQDRGKKVLTKVLRKVPKKVPRKVPKKVLTKVLKRVLRKLLNDFASTFDVASTCDVASTYDVTMEL